ncbi:MAG: hypothetical protein AB8B93_14060 [Pseudomonadales bacterium]
MSQEVTALSPEAPVPLTSFERLAEVLACPVCAAPLAPQAATAQCEQCQTNYPSLGAVPWLCAQPEANIAEWRNRWHRALRALASDEQSAQQALQDSHSALTRARLTVLRDGYAAQRQAVQHLLSPLEIGMAATAETYMALRTPLPEHHGLFSYAPNLFRDWSWGSVENRGALNALLEALEQGNGLQPARIAVLGAGAGRLAYDLHTKLQPALTAAIEINPYLALSAAHLCAGNSLELTEFPLAPRSNTDCAVQRTLRCPDPEASAGLVFVGADALAPPFLPGSFDLVVTPWFSDICGAGPKALASIVNGLLSDSGLWLNHGSVAFAGPDPSACPGIEEFVEQVGEQQMHCEYSMDTTLPYLQSPSSRHGRVEVVNTMLLRKGGDCETLTDHPLALPKWLEQTSLAVPASNAFKTQSNTTAIHAFLMSLIDGNRSIDAMAEVVAARGMMPAPDAQQALRGFLETMLAEARTGRSR